MRVMVLMSCFRYTLISFLQSLTHSSESYPGRTSSSVRFYGNSTFSVPGDLLAPLTGLKNYTIAVYFKEEASNG